MDSTSLAFVGWRNGKRSPVVLGDKRGRGRVARPPADPVNDDRDEYGDGAVEPVS